MKGDGTDHVSERVDGLPCPHKGTAATVNVTVENPWREEIGSHVKGCTLLPPGQSCDEACLHTPEGAACIHKVAQADLAEHQQELGKIGRNGIA